MVNANWQTVFIRQPEIMEKQLRLGAGVVKNQGRAMGTHEFQHIGDRIAPAPPGPGLDLDLGLDLVQNLVQDQGLVQGLDLAQVLVQDLGQRLALAQQLVQFQD